jgi:endonuclease-8
MIRRAQDYPDTRRQLRLAIHTGRHSALLYSASDISVWPVADLPQHPFLSKVGPDVLDPALTPAMLLERFKSPPYQRRQLAGLLLDQRFLCGIGNYLRSELLFVARLAPRLRSIDCPAERLQALAEAAIALPYQSYRYNGITNDLDLANQLKAQGQRRSQYRHWVFSRQGQPCRLCQTPIVKEMIGSRRVYYCPVCQGIGRF